MAECSVWYVPQDQARFVGKATQIADAFWNHGVFLETEDDRIHKRIAEWNRQGKPLPECRHDFAFSAMGLGEAENGCIVPEAVDDLSCPECAEDITDDAHEVLDDETLGEVSRRSITCPHCEAMFPASRLVSKKTPFTFARVCLWVSDIDPGEWDGSFKETVEKVLGPCDEFMAWEP